MSISGGLFHETLRSIGLGRFGWLVLTPITCSRVWQARYSEREREIDPDIYLWDACVVACEHQESANTKHQMKRAEAVRTVRLFSNNGVRIRCTHQARSGTGTGQRHCSNLPVLHHVT